MSKAGCTACLAVVCVFVGGSRAAARTPTAIADPALPDLIESGGRTYFCPPFSTFNCVGCEPTIGICVANIGTAAAGPFTVSEVDSGTQYDIRRFDGLAAGERRCWDTGAILFADIEILLLIDSKNEVVESNEDNNRGRETGRGGTPVQTCSPLPSPTPTPPPPSTPTPGDTCINGCNPTQSCFVTIGGNTETGQCDPNVGCRCRVLGTMTATPTAPPTPTPTGCGDRCDPALCPPPLRFSRDTPAGCCCLSAEDVVTTPTPTGFTACVGDCNVDRGVTIDELITCVNIDLGSLPLGACPACSTSPDSGAEITVNEILVAVNNALSGCPAEPTPIASGGIRYRLFQSTMFINSQGPLPTPVLSLAESLSGSFVAIPSEATFADGRPAYFTLRDIAFDGELYGDLYIVKGSMGEIAVLPSGEQVVMAATVTINGQQVKLNGGVPLTVLSDQYPPTFNGIQACGAPGRLVTCEALSAGTQNGYDLRLWAAPEATQTPLPTRTPTPTLVVTYQLTQGSTITLSSATPGSPRVVELLSGTFTTRVVCVGPDCFEQLAPNTWFHAEITGIAFQSPGFSVTGTGYLDVTTLNNPLEVYMFADVVINGQPIGLNGGGSFNTASYPPIFSDLEACGGAVDRAVLCEALHNGSDRGFSLTIFATPER